VILDALTTSGQLMDPSPSGGRAGWVCGSCGMKVNGTPKLSARPSCPTTCPSHSRGAPGLLPRGARPRSGPSPFHAKLKQVKPGSSATRRNLERGEYLRRPIRLIRTSSSACASTACCATPACPIYGLEPSFIVQPPSPWPNVTTWIPGPGGGGAPEDPLRARRHLAVHLSWASARRCAPNTWIPRAPSNRTSSPPRPTGSSTAPPGGTR